MKAHSNDKGENANGDRASYQARWAYNRRQSSSLSYDPYMRHTGTQGTDVKTARRIANSDPGYIRGSLGIVRDLWNGTCYKYHGTGESDPNLDAAWEADQPPKGGEDNEHEQAQGRKERRRRKARRRVPRKRA